MKYPKTHNYTRYYSIILNGLRYSKDPMHLRIMSIVMQLMFGQTGPSKLTCIFSSRQEVRIPYRGNGEKCFWLQRIGVKERELLFNGYDWMTVLNNYIIDMIYYCSTDFCDNVTM